MHETPTSHSNSPNIAVSKFESRIINMQCKNFNVKFVLYLHGKTNEFQYSCEIVVNCKEFQIRLKIQRRARARKINDSHHVLRIHLHSANLAKMYKNCTHSFFHIQNKIATNWSGIYFERRECTSPPLKNSGRFNPGY